MFSDQRDPQISVVIVADGHGWCGCMVRGVVPVACRGIVIVDRGGLFTSFDS